jgi:hypothetical protein
MSESLCRKHFREDQWHLEIRTAWLFSYIWGDFSGEFATFWWFWHLLMEE